MSAIILPEPAAVDLESPGPGVVYTETLVWSAPAQFLQDAPYQLAIVELERGDRLTGRITGEKPVDKNNHSAKAAGYLLLHHLGQVERLSQPKSWNRLKGDRTARNIAMPRRGALAAS